MLFLGIVFTVPVLVGLGVAIYATISVHCQQKYLDRMEFEYWAEGIDDDFPE